MHHSFKPVPIWITNECRVVSSIIIQPNARMSLVNTTRTQCCGVEPTNSIAIGRNETQVEPRTWRFRRRTMSDDCKRRFTFKALRPVTHASRVVRQAHKAQRRKRGIIKSSRAAKVCHTDRKMIEHCLPLRKARHKLAQPSPEIVLQRKPGRAVAHNDEVAFGHNDRELPIIAIRRK
jgi:hypothetical protein